jgi:hypothetical protein
MSPNIEHISFPPSCSASNESDVASERPYSALAAFPVLTCELSCFKPFAISASANPESQLAITSNG